MTGDREPREETPHITAVRRQWRLRQQAAQKPHFKVVNGEMVPYTVRPPADDLATTVAAAEEEEFLRNPQPGQQFAEKGIFLGQYAPKDRDGNSLGKVFNVYAAPKDLPGTMNYLAAVKSIAALKNWHGHDGTDYTTDKEIYKALKDGSYNGGWIIPTRELLAGTEADGPAGVRKGTIVQPDNLFDHQNNGAFKGTFKTARPVGSDYHVWYWSSTEDRDDPSYVWHVRLPNGFEEWCRKDYGQKSCRPVRLESRP